MALTRRAFLKVSAATGAGTMLATQFPSRKGASQEKTPKAPEERWVPNVCLQCPAGCGILVRVVDGRAVKIEGNPEHPINLGRLCPKGHIGLQILYDPDRIKGPMRRVGARGEGKWERISWDEALDTVAKRLRGLRAKGEPHRLVVMSGRNRGQMGGLLDRFLDAYGSPNHVGHSSICADGTAQAHYLTQGFKAYAGYDWDNTNYLLCFGGGFIEAWRPTTRLLRAFGHMRRERPIRAKIVQVEPRFSVTAAKADEWIPINPGTDAALALGIAHVIVKEELYDQAFVAEHTFGFEGWVDEKTGKKHMGFKTLVLEQYPPKRVAEITGVPEATIIRLAREFATTPPAIAAGERGASMQTNGVYNRMAIHALNALVGSLEVSGGVIVQHGPPLTKWPEVVLDEIAKGGGKQPRIDYAGTKKYPLAGKVYQDMPEMILGEGPYPLDTLLLYYTNPMFSTPDVRRWEKAIEKIPFIVSFSPFLDETTAYADLILPDDTYLERWHDDVIYPSLGYPVISLRQPVVKPLFDTRNTGDALIELAKRIGGSVARSFPWKDYRELIREKVKGLHEAQKGNIVAPTFDKFWEEFTEKGFWAAPPYKFRDWEHGFKTPSKRFEFFSQNLEHKLEELAKKEVEKTKEKRKALTEEQALEEILRGVQLKARGDEVYLPHYEPIRHIGDPAKYPLLLNTYKLMTHAEGRGANSPWLQEILGVHVGVRWDSWVEINPETAKKLGIRDGDPVWVESVVGKIKTRAKLYPGAMPQVVNMPFELGHRAYGRYAKGRGVNPNEILVHENDRLGGLAGFFSTRVRVYKA
ncbi:MAG: molybdopterin-dependent oxidoreductase [Candidatus Rokubacteria bacterium]|nr:molybdopterin-dependent oxidoreductase [Candidatus Rokubacteria bacterium]